MEALHVEVAGKLLFSKDLLPAVSNTYDLKEGWKERKVHVGFGSVEV